MKLREADTVIQVGHWMVSKGFHVAEGPGPFGPVDRDAHSETSLHYRGLALDVNYHGGGDWRTEEVALRWLYRRIMKYRRRHPDWPLDELFHGDRGFIWESGVGSNHPAPGHTGHLHVGFSVDSWR